MSSYSEGQTHQLMNALEAAGFTADEVTRLGQNAGRHLKLVREKLPLLTPVRTSAPTGTKPTISWRSDNFKGWFYGVAEGERAEKITLHKLERDSLDASIVATLGGEEATEVTLSDLYAALAEKEAGKDFTCLIAYVKDKDGILCAVDVRWGSDGRGWVVFVVSVGNPDEWGAGLQVLSRPSTA